MTLPIKRLRGELDDPLVKAWTTERLSGICPRLLALPSLRLPVVVVTHQGGVGYREVYPSMAHGETMRYNPTPSAGSHHRLAAVADPFRLQALAAGWHHGMCLPAPDTPAAPPPPVPLAERLAALRAAVMGAPVWTPPLRPSRPGRDAAEPVDATIAEAAPV